MENEIINNQTQVENEAGAEVESKKTFQELLDTDKEYRSAFDKAITKATETAIGNAKSEWLKEYEAEKTEAEKLAKMNADEKLQYELENTKNELEKTKNEKDSLTSYINSLELRTIASSYANEKGLPYEYYKDWDFAKETAETVKSKIDTLTDIRQKDIQGYINQQLKQQSPKAVDEKVETEDPFIKGFKMYNKQK